MQETRIKKIVDILTSDYEYHTSKEIAEVLNVSSRTIRDEIKIFNDKLNGKGAQVKLVPRKGCKFEISDKKEFEHFLKKDWYKIAFIENSLNNPEYRIGYILRLLLFEANYVKSEDIIGELYISISQFNIDLKSVRSILSNYNLKLISKPYYGIMVEGSELNKRLCLSSCYNKSTYYSKDFFNIEKKKNKEIIRKIEKIINEAFVKYNYEISDIAYKNLVIHLYIMIKRILSTDNVYIELEDIVRLQSKSEYKIAEHIVLKLEEELNLTFPEQEIAYISIHLLGKKINIANTKKNISAEIEELTYLMLKKIKIICGLDLMSDLELRISLGLHLGPLIERVQYGLIMRNPLLEEIKKDYVAYECSRVAISVIEKKYNTRLSEDEIAYIALHISLAISRLNENKQKKNIIIVCATGTGTAKLMKHRFITEFGDYVNELITCNYLQLKDMLLEVYDLIITSIPLNIKTDIPIVEVGVYLDKKDVNNISPFIKTSNKYKGIKSLFDEKLFFNKSAFKDMRYKKIILNLCKVIEKEREISENLYKKIMDREKIGSTSIGNGIVLLHPITPVSNETFITVYVNEHGIQWDNKTVYVIVMLNIKKGDESKKLEDFLIQLSQFIFHKENIQKAKKSKNLQEFIDIFINS